MTDGNGAAVDGSAKSGGLLEPLPTLKLVPEVEEKLDAGLRSLDHCEKGLTSPLALEFILIPSHR